LRLEETREEENMADREEVAGAAVRLEKDGREFYLDAAAKTKSDIARKMFEGLAQDELNHIDWIENVSPGANTAEIANRELYDRLKPIFAGAPAGLRLSAELTDTDIEAIDIAIGMEEKSIAAYEEWAAEDGSEDVQALCRALAGQEHFHRQMLENTKQYLDKTADWFMQEEQWNFEGA
jgi:rubrerythrin